MRVVRQILAIACTEIRFGFRRGALVVTTVLIGLIVGAGLLLGPIANLPIARDDLQKLLQDSAKIERLNQIGLSMETYRMTSAGTMAEMSVIDVPMTWPILLIAVCLLLTTAAATCLPADHKFGAAELIHSLPLGGGTYLAGKLLGMLASVALCSLIPYALFFLVFEGELRYYLGADLPAELVWFYLKFGLLAVLPLVAWALVAGTLAGLPFRTRRAAILPGLLAGILSIFLWLAVFKAPALPYQQLDLNAYYLVQNYHSTALDALVRASGLEPPPLLGAEASILGLGRVIGGNILLIAGLIGLFLLARLWLLWKENF